MPRPTEEKIQEAIEASWHQYEGNSALWWVSSPKLLHTIDQVRWITEACLILGTPVSDVATARAWCAMAVRLADIEDRVDAMERLTDD